MFVSNNLYLILKKNYISIKIFIYIYKTLELYEIFREIYLENIERLIN